MEEMKKAVIRSTLVFVTLVVVCTILLAPTREGGEVFDYGTMKTIEKLETIRLAPIFVKVRDENNTILLRSNKNKILEKSGGSPLVAIIKPAHVYDQDGNVMDDVFGSPDKFAFDYWLYIIVFPALITALIVFYIYYRRAIPSYSRNEVNLS